MARRFAPFVRPALVNGAFAVAFDGERPLTGVHGCRPRGSVDVFDDPS
jgi:hypothetical protein